MLEFDREVDKREREREKEKQTPRQTIFEKDRKINL